MDLLDTVEEPLKAVPFEGEVVISGSVCLAMTPEAALASAAALKQAAEALLGDAVQAPVEERSWIGRDSETTRLS
jgi:hypothetical protein